jgi:hypothetical protein
MDLKERFDSVIMRHDLCRNEFEETKEQCIEIAEEYAIDFADWCKQEYELEDTQKNNKWRDVNGDYKTSKQLLEIFKKEKGL